MENKEAKQKVTPPYMAYKSFRNFIDGLRVAMPGRIDRSVMNSLAGSVQTQILQTLSYFKLIDGEGIPSERLTNLVNSEGAHRQKLMKELLVIHYPFIFKDGFDIHRGTSRQLEECFSEIGISGDTVRKCVAFFLSASKEAGFQISPYIKMPRNRTVVARPRKQAAPANPSNGKERQPVEEETNFPDRTDEMGWSKLLLSKFPSFDPAWPDEVKASWFKAFDKLMQMGKEEEGIEE